MPLASRVMLMAAAGQGAAPDSGVVGFQDAFTDSNGTNLTAHAPDVDAGDATWSADEGTITVESNVAVVGAGTADYTIDTYYSAGRLSGRYKCGAANGNFAPSISFRGVEPGRYMLAYFSGDGSGVLYRRNTGVGFTTLDTFTCPSDTSWHDFEIVFFEYDIEVFIDSVSVCTYTADDNDYNGTFIGLRGFKVSSDADAFDDLTFTIPADMEYSAFPGDFSTPVFTDDFGDANGTQLGAIGWTEHTGDWTTESGHAEQALTSAPVMGYLATVDAGTPDFAVEVAVTTPATGDFIMGVCVRFQDSDHFLEWELNKSSAPLEGSGLYWYDDDVDTVFHRIVTHAFSPANATTYTFQVRCKGTYFIAEVVEAGIIVAAQCSKFAAASETGLFEFRDVTRPNAPHYDDFVVST